MKILRFADAIAKKWLKIEGPYPPTQKGWLALFIIQYVQKLLVGDWPE